MAEGLAQVGIVRQRTRRARVTSGTKDNRRSTRSSCSMSSTATVTCTFAVPALRSVVVVMASIDRRSCAITSETSRTSPCRSFACTEIATDRSAVSDHCTVNTRSGFVARMRASAAQSLRCTITPRPGVR